MHACINLRLGQVTCLDVQAQAPKRFASAALRYLTQLMWVEQLLLAMIVLVDSKRSDRGRDDS